MLDTEDVGSSGHDKDKEHVKNILRLLSAYDKIHAICILLKANETRLSDAFKYTLTEIMTNLDKTACKNVVFIFANAASANFKKTKTQPILQKFLSESNLQIPLPPDKPTIYCFENDTVQYLAERKNNITPGEDDKEDVTKSWTKSVAATSDLIGYVCSLDPLPFQGINAMYDAEWTISILSRLVLETLTCILKDTKELEQKQRDADKMKTEISRDPAAFAPDILSKLLHITESRIIRVPLGHTNVVCEASRCAKDVNGEIVYPQICCNGCWSWFMYFCRSINWLGECERCACGKSKHEWRTTETKIVKKTRQNPEVVDKIVDSNSALKEINRIKLECEERVKSRKEEAEQMLRTCAHLNNFVRKTALLQRSGVDEMTRNLNNRMAVYERFDDTIKESLVELRKISAQYNAFLAENVDYKQDDMQEQIQKLYRLPTKGKDLREAIETEKSARAAALLGRKRNPVTVISRPGFA